MKIGHARSLLLNADYTPLSVISWRRALVLKMLHDYNPNSGYDVIDYYNDYVYDTKGRCYPLPAVVRAIVYVKNRHKSIPFSRKNIFIRDALTCSYCGKQLPPEKLTFDHVVPRSKYPKNLGTPTCWSNITTSCIPCNRRKDDKTLKEAGMKLLREPIKPSPSIFVLGLSPWSRVHKSWLTYLNPLYKEMCQVYE